MPHTLLAVLRQAAMTNIPSMLPLHNTGTAWASDTLLLPLLLLMLQPASDIEEAVLMAPVPADALTPPELWLDWEQRITGQAPSCDCCRAELAPDQEVSRGRHNTS